MIFNSIMTRSADKSGYIPPLPSSPFLPRFSSPKEGSGRLTHGKRLQFFAAVELSFLTCLICSTSAILGTNGLNSADVPLSNKQTKLSSGDGIFEFVISASIELPKGGGSGEGASGHQDGFKQHELATDNTIY